MLVVHAFPQAPQLLTLLVGSTQEPLQSVGVAAGHPPSHDSVPGGHAAAPSGASIPGPLSFADWVSLDEAPLSAAGTLPLSTAAPTWLSTVASAFRSKVASSPKTQTPAASSRLAASASTVASPASTAGATVVARGGKMIGVLSTSIPASIGVVAGPRFEVKSGPLHAEGRAAASAIPRIFERSE